MFNGFKEALIEFYGHFGGRGYSGVKLCSFVMQSAANFVHTFYINEARPLVRNTIQWEAKQFKSNNKLQP